MDVGFYDETYFGIGVKSPPFFFLRFKSLEGLKPGIVLVKAGT